MTPSLEQVNEGHRGGGEGRQIYGFIGGWREDSRGASWGPGLNGAGQTVAQSLVGSYWQCDSSSESL